MEEPLKHNQVFLPFDFALENGKVIPSKQLEFINNGANGSVWKWNDGYHVWAIKSFFDDRYHLSLPRDICLEFQNMNFVNLPNIHFTLSRIGNPLGTYDAYLMDYFSPAKECKIIEIPSESLILSIEQLQEDGKRLSEKGIIMFDVKPENSIITENDLMVHFIDLDLYKKVTNRGYEEILSIQYKMIRSFLSASLKLDILNDFSFTAVEKINLLSFIQECFSNSSDCLYTPKELVEQLFSDVDNPKQFLKKKI